MNKIIEEERASFSERLGRKDEEISTLRGRVEEMETRHLTEGLEIAAIREAQEKLEREYQAITESLTSKVEERDLRIATLTKDLMFLHQAQAQERAAL